MSLPLELCSLAGIHTFGKWGESFWHNTKLYQRRHCDLCGAEQWRAVTEVKPQ